MLNEHGDLLSNTKVTADIFQMEAQLPEIARRAQPGQFVHIRTGPADGTSFDPLLRRPFSIYKALPESGMVSVLYQVVGRGTKMLSQRRSGEAIDVLGPVGHGFHISDELRCIVLVAGGMGVPPLVFLAHRLAALGVEIIALIGARVQDRVLGKDELRSLGAQVEIATDDGSEGYAGPVTDLLLESPGSSSMDHIFAVGPDVMLRKVAKFALSHQIPCQISLESRMACGVGACLGCVVQVHSKDEMPQYKRVCVDGPVFDTREIIF